MALADGDTNVGNGAKQGHNYHPNDDQNSQFNNVVNNFDGRRMRSKTTTRKTVDYNSSFANLNQIRIFQRDHRDRPDPQPDALYNFQSLPPIHLVDKPVDCLNTRPIRMAMNKVKCPIFTVKWTPEGRRLITGASSGEFTLWNGLTFSFETILQAHDAAVRAMVWSHSDQWMITADHNGFVKYWQSNMNNVKMYQIHKEPVRGLTFSPTDHKYASCSDDSTVRIWDFLTCAEKAILRGHGSDVRCVDWHPFNSLLLSGSRDAQQPLKMWDPRSAKSVTIHAHKNTVMDLKWNRNGKLFLTASRDHLVKLFDLRNLKAEVQTFKGHNKEATALSWHPIHEDLFASGGSDGSIFFWLLDKKQEVNSISQAHDTMVWSLDWHPLGHILVSGSNDHTTKFWTRSQFGDQMRDRYNLNTLPPGVEDADEVEAADLEHLVPKPAEKLQFFSNTGPIPFLDLPSSDPADMPSLTEGVHGDLHLERFKEATYKSSKKALHSKTVPHEFQRAWMTGRQPAHPSRNYEDPDLTLEDEPFTVVSKLPAPPHLPKFPPNHSVNDYYPNDDWAYDNHPLPPAFRNFPSRDHDFVADFHPPPPHNWGRGRFPMDPAPLRHHDNFPRDIPHGDNKRNNAPGGYFNEKVNYHQNKNYDRPSFNNDNQRYDQENGGKAPPYLDRQQSHRFRDNPRQQYQHNESQNQFPDQKFPHQRPFPDVPPQQQHQYPPQQPMKHRQLSPPHQPQQHYNHFNDNIDNDNYNNYPSYHFGDEDNRGRSHGFQGNHQNRSEFRDRGRNRNRPYQRNR